MIVRGEDQVFSIRETLASRRQAVISGAGGFNDSDSPPDGVYWIVTGSAGVDGTTATTRHDHHHRHAGVDALFHVQTQAFAIGEGSSWQGQVVLEHDDVIRVYFMGGLAGDTNTIHLTGYVMTLEV